MLAHAAAVAAATDLPVSIDLENGFGDAPEIVAETIRFARCADKARLALLMMLSTSVHSTRYLIGVYLRSSAFRSFVASFKNTLEMGAENGGSLRLVCGAVLESLAPARRIGQRWRATRAPSPVSIRMGRATRSALFVVHPVLGKAINSFS